MGALSGVLVLSSPRLWFCVAVGAVARSMGGEIKDRAGQEEGETKVAIRGTTCYEQRRPLDNKCCLALQALEISLEVVKRERFGQRDGPRPPQEVRKPPEGGPVQLGGRIPQRVGVPPPCARGHVVALKKRARSPAATASSGAMVTWAQPRRLNLQPLRS